MKKTTTLIVALLALPILCFSQQQVVKYYKNLNLTKEVSEKKGKYIVTTTTNKDSSITKEIKDIKSGILLLSETLKDGEPYGTWVDRISTLYYKCRVNYGFNVTYSKEECTNNIPINTKNALVVNVDNGYQPPVIIGFSNIYQYMAYTMVYPTLARERGIQGKVQLSYTVSEKGEITNIIVNKSADKHLDKEAVRIIREMKIKQPAKFNGKNVSICVSLPIKFILG